MMLKKGKKRNSSTPGICSQTLTAGILNRNPDGNMMGTHDGNTQRPRSSPQPQS